MSYSRKTFLILWVVPIFFSGTPEAREEPRPYLRGAEAEEVFNTLDRRMEENESADEVLAMLDGALPVAPGIDLRAFRFKLVEGQTYRVDFLFGLSAGSEDVDWSNLSLNLRGRLDSKREDTFLNEFKGSEAWNLKLGEGTEPARIGDLVRVSSEIRAQPIPYDLYFILLDRKKKERVGDRVVLGWFLDRGEEDTGGDASFLRRLKWVDLGGGGSADALRVEGMLDVRLEGIEPLWRINASLDFLGYGVEPLGEDSYRIHLLLRVNRDVWGNYKFYLGGEPIDAEGRAFRREYPAGFEFWPFWPEPNTSTWRRGSLVLISRKITAHAGAYDLAFSLVEPGRNGSQLFGDRVPLGRRTLANEPRASVRERLRDTDSIFDLREIRGDYAEGSTERELVQSKIDRAFSRVEPLREIGLGIEFVEFDFRRTDETSGQVRFLFRAVRDVTEDLRIQLYGKLPKNFQSRIRREYPRDHEFWVIWPKVPTSEWKAGEFVFVAEDIDVEPLPYDLGFQLYRGKSWKNRSSYIRIGHRIERATGRFDQAPTLKPLATSRPFWKVSDELDYYDCALARVGDRSRFTFLFRALEPIEKDCEILLYGIPANPEDPEFLKKHPKGRRIWRFRPDPPMPEWKPGEFVSVEWETTRIDEPYDYRILLVEREGGGRYGDGIKIGWKDPDLP